MAAPKVRADYDQLKQAASAFGRSSANCQQTLQRLKSNLGTLQGGDWIGQGASAFYQEMGDSVLPKLQRLINALNTAQSSLTQISSIMKDAEDQAANVLKGPGGGSGPIGASFGAAAGAGLGAPVGASAASPMGAATSAGAQFAGNTIGGAASSDWIKASSATSPQATINNIGFPKADAGSKDPGFIGTSSGAQFSPTAGNLADGISNTIGGAARTEWIKASDAASPQGPINNVGFPQMDGASKDAAKINIQGEQFSQKIDSNTVGGAPSADWIKASSAASPKIDTNALGSKISQTWTEGGKTFQDDWSQQTGSANTIGGAAAGGQRQHLPTDFGTGLGGDAGSVHNAFQAAATGANTIGGAAAGDLPIHAGGGVPPAGANTIGGAAAGDLAAHESEIGALGSAQAPSVGNSPTRVSETFQGIEHTDNLAGGAATDDWQTGSSDPDQGGHK